MKQDALLASNISRSAFILISLLVKGAKGTLQVALRQTPDKANRLQLWIVQMYVRVGYHKTLVAIANKHARTIWAILARNERYDANAWQRMRISAT